MGKKATAKLVSLDKIPAKNCLETRGYWRYDGHMFILEETLQEYFEIPDEAKTINFQIMKRHSKNSILLELLWNKTIYEHEAKINGKMIDAALCGLVYLFEDRKTNKLIIGNPTYKIQEK